MLIRRLASSLAVAESYRTIAEMLAAEGYMVLAADLYSGKTGSNPQENVALMRQMMADSAKMIANLDAAAKFLRAQPGATGKIATIGWCMGGGFALDLAEEEPRVAAVVVNYGRLPTEAATIAKLKAPVLGNFGAEDKGIPPESVSAFAAKAEQAGVKTDLKVYPGAGHAFASSPTSNTPACEIERPRRGFLTWRLSQSAGFFLP